MKLIHPTILASAVLCLTQTSLRCGEVAGLSTDGRAALVLPNDKVFPHIAVGGSWETELTLITLDGRTPVPITLSFYGTDGKPLALRVTGQAAPVSTVSLSLPVTETWTTRLTNAGESVATGWVLLRYDSSAGRVGGHALFRQRVSGRPDFEATVPLMSSTEDQMVLPFDDRQGTTTAVALANPANVAAQFDLEYLDADGNHIQAVSLTMEPFSQTSFTAGTRFPAAAGKTGVLLVVSHSGNLSGVGLRFNSSGAFTSVPFVSAPAWFQKGKGPNP